MAIKSFERYRRGELRSIYEKPKSYTGRRDLDFSPFEPDLQAFPAGRADEISGMLKGITLPELQVLFEAGRLAVEELTLYLLDRIRRCDRDRLNSVSELNPEALEIARSLDAERQTGRMRGPLHGAPVLLKDNIGTGDRLHVSAGAKALEANRSDRDAFLAARLREAGALILGKNNLSEWANFMGKKMPSGFSVVGGQTRSPYGPFMVWGSSSGSAVSVAAGFAFGSVGSETCGSIVAPASQNSVCGLKPSLGLVSRDRMIPLAGAMDTAGPFARTMTDLAVLLNALRGVDSNDRQTESAAELADTDFTQFLDPDGLRGMRIGLLRPGREATAGDWEILDRAADFLQSGGAEVVAMKEPARLPKGVKLMPVLCYSFREELGRYLEAVGAPVRSLAEVIEFNQADPANRAPWGMENLLSAQGCDLSRDDFDALVQRNRERTAEAIRRKLAAGRLDLLLTLANSYSGFYATAGFPALCVPGGYRASGEPVGVTFVGDYLDEPALIRAGYAFERISRLRRDPVL